MKLLYCLLFLCFITFSMSEDPRCSQPIDSGICFGNIEKFGYDIAEQKCIQFVYGGCFGNENQFDSLEECQAVCP